MSENLCTCSHPQYRHAQSKCTMCPCSYFSPLIEPGDDYKKAAQLYQVGLISGDEASAMIPNAEKNLEVYRTRVAICRCSHPEAHHTNDGRCVYGSCSCVSYHLKTVQDFVTPKTVYNYDSLTHWSTREQVDLAAEELKRVEEQFNSPNLASINYNGFTLEWTSVEPPEIFTPKILKSGPPKVVKPRSERKLALDKDI